MQTHFNHLRYTCRFLFAVAASWAVSGTVDAQNGNWNVNNNGNWSLNTNWNPVAVPGNAAGNIVGLTNDISAATRTVTIDTTSRTVGTLNIGDSNNTNSFILAASGGGTLTFNNSGSGAVLNETGSMTDTISAPVTLADNLAVAVAGSLTMSAAIGETGGARSLTKTGSGRLLLSGVNSYTGKTLISGGTLRFGTTWNGNTWVAGGSLPANSNLEINGGIAEAWYYRTFSGLGTGAGQIQLTGGRSGFSNLQGDATGAAFVLFTSAATTVTWGTSTFNPSTLVLNDAGAAVTVLRTSNPFDLNGAARTVEVSSTGTGVGGRGSYATMEGNLSGVGGGLIKTGVGTLMLNGTNSYTGGTTINGGGLWFHRIAAMPSSGAVNVNDGGILSVSVGGAGQWTTGTSGVGTVGGLLAGLGGAGSSTVSYSGNVGLGLNVTGTQTYSGNISNVGTSLSLYVGNKDAGTASDPFAQTGTLILSGNNNYTGSTNIAPNSTLRLLTTAAASATSAFNLAAGTALQLRSDTSGTFGNVADVNLNLPVHGNSTTIDVNNNGSGSNNTLTLGGALNARDNGSTIRTLNVTGGNGYTLSIGSANITGGNNLTLNPTTANLNIGSITATTGATVYSGANNITLTLGGSGTNNSITSIAETSGAAQQLIITKNTAATWTLGNVNVRAGNVHTVSAGNLILNGTFEWTSTNADRRLTVSSTGALHYNNAGAMKTLNGRLIMAGGSLDNSSGAAISTSTHNPNMEWAGDWTFIGSNGANSNLNYGTGNVTITGATPQVTVQDAATTLAFGGVISGSGFGLTKAGPGALALNGTSTYNGTTTVNAGTMLIGGNAPNAAAGALGNASSAVLVGDTSGAANASLLTNGAFAVGRAITVQTGSSGVKTIGGNTDNNSSFGGAIGLADNLRVAQVATTGTNTLTISGGISSSTAGLKTVTFDNAGSVAVTTTAISDGSGQVGVTQTGAGRTTFSAMNTYSGGTTVNNGTLLVNNTSGSGTGSGNVLVNAGGALGGTGTIGGNVTGAGNIAPGLSPGAITIGGLFDMSGTYLWELGAHEDDGTGGIAGIDWDLVNAGTADLDGLTLDLSFILLSTDPDSGDPFWNTDHTWLIVDSSNAVTGNFSAITFGGGAVDFEDGTFKTSVNGNQAFLQFTSAAAVPEPASIALWSLIGLGLVGLGVRRASGKRWQRLF